MHKFFKAGLLASSLLIAPHLASAQVTPNNMTPVPSGVYVSPTAIPGSTQQFLNPQLANYPNFVAGEAVRQQVSPGGNTLAVITAGENSLYFTSGSNEGKTDVANSTQYVFIYDVSGANKAQP